MAHQKNGIPKPASLTSIIQNLFQNEEICEPTKIDITFSGVNLTEEQKSRLIYPINLQEYINLNLYIIYQTDEETRYTLQLVSFLKKDGYIYGYYFDIFAQPRYDICDLIYSKEPVTISDIAQFIYSQYNEVYNDVNGLTTILGLSTQPIYASLQYSIGCYYYYETLYNTGINMNIPVTKLIGLSRNLRKL